MHDYRIKQQGERNTTPLRRESDDEIHLGGVTILKNTAKARIDYRFDGEK